MLQLAVREYLHPEVSATNRSRMLNESVALCILAVAAWLRFYHLGVPSMWSDELMVAVTADFPIPYIAKWAMTLEVHPPYYHFFIKLVELVGRSDFALRLPSALAGTATVWLAWRLGRRIVAPGGALLVSALFAVNPLHVWISRQLRPYAILVLFSLFAFYFLYRFLQSGDGRQLFRLFWANLGIILLHFISILVVGAEVALILGYWALRRRQAPGKGIAFFLGATALSFAPILPFLLTMFALRSDMTAPAPFAVCLHNTVNYAGGVLNLFFPGWVTAAMAGLAFLGLGVFFFTDRKLFFLCLSLVVLPVAVILAKRYNTFYYSSHLSFMLSPLLFPVAAGLGFLTGLPAVRRLAAVGLCLGFGALLFVRGYDKLYNEDSSIVTWYDFGPMKTTTRELEAILMPGDAVIAHDPMARSFFDWYLYLLPSGNVMKEQILRPEDQNVRVWLLGLGEGFGHLAKNDGELRALAGYAGSRKIQRYALHELDLERAPAQIVDALPYAASLTARPADVYVRAWSMRGLAIHPYWNFTLYPTANDREGVVEYLFRNEIGRSGMTVNLGAFYENAVQGGMLELTSRFDDEEEAVVFTSRGPDKNRYAASSFTRTKPWKTLRLTARLLVPRTTPRYSGGNLTGVSLESLSVAICSQADPGPCSDVEYRNVVGMLQRAYRDQAFLDASAYPAQKADLEAAGFVKEASDYPGWAVLSPKDGQTAVLTVDLGKAGPDAVYYPRVSGLDGSVTVYAVDKGGRRRELATLKGLPGVWTPISAQYLVGLSSLADGETRLQVELTGRFAQLWAKNGQVFF